MAATATLLTDDLQAANPATTASVSPTNESYLELDVDFATTAGAGATSDDLDVSGLGATWVLVDTQVYQSRRVMCRYRCESDGTGGTITLTYSGPGTFAEMGWSLKQWTGQVTGNNGADATGTSTSDAVTSGTSLGLTVPGTPASGDATSCFFGLELSGGTGSLEAGFTTLSDSGDTGSDLRQMLTGSRDASQDVTPSVTWGSSAGAGGIANLVIAAGGGSGQDITPAPVTVTVSAGTLSLAIGVTPDPVTVTATPGTLAMAVDVPLAGPAITAAPGTLALATDTPLAAASVTATPGAVTVTTSTTVTPDQVTVTATPGTLTVSTGTTDITPPPVTVTAGAGTLSLDLAVAPAAATVTATPGAATVSAGAVAITPAAVTVTALAGTVSVSNAAGATPAERVYDVAADDRTLSVSSDDRTLLVASDDRTLLIT